MKKTIWISHSAISAFSRCPHLYYYQYEYRNPKTGNRIQTINPYFSLGLAVHETVESLSDVPIKKRTSISLEERFEKIFKNYHGIKGGFLSKKKEEKFKKRGLSMVKKVEGSPLLHNPSTSTTTDFPTVNLSKNGSVKLVGSLDWIEILPSGGAHIIDFKTGSSKENGNSLQLPIYVILSKGNLSKTVEKVSYWYLENDDEPVTQKIEDLSLSMEKIKEKAYNIKEAVEQKFFPCNYPGRCFACSEYEKIFAGEAEMIETDGKRNKDVFFVLKKEDIVEKVLEEDYLDEREKKIFEMRIDTSMERINQELRLTPEKSGKIVQSIKEKIKKNLSAKELQVLVNFLRK